MICTIKQEAYLHYQWNELKKQGIYSAPIAFDSFVNIPEYVPQSIRQNLHLRAKEVAGFQE